MGYDRWEGAAYDSYKTAAAIKTRKELYHKTSKRSVSRSGQQVNAEDIKFRESRDSAKNPLSTPVMVALDVTGSMGYIPENLTKGNLGQLMGQLLERKPVSDPHLLFMGIGDANCDQAPLQATQFEADVRICDQLTDLWLEGGGGGNHFESYDLAWAFAALRTETDAWDKRKQKGFLFTVGDEEFPGRSNDRYRRYCRDVFGGDCPQDPTPQGFLAAAQERYNVFHIIISEGSYARSNPVGTVNTWKQNLAKRALVLDDFEKLGELIVSAIALEEGQPLNEVLQGWDTSTANVIEKALQ